MKPSEVLAKAADLIEAEGTWTQGPDGSDEPCWCLYTAVCHVVGHGPAGRSDEPMRFARKALGRRFIYDSDVFDWNDAPERTQAEVVAALRKAASLARSEGQ